jgi:hypothetical protein
LPQVDNGTNFQIFETDFCLENYFDPSTDESFLSGFLCKNATPTVELNLTSEVVHSSIRCGTLDLKLLLSRMRLVYTIFGLGPML